MPSLRTDWSFSEAIIPVFDLKNDQGGISAHRRGCRGLIRWILLPSSGKGKVLLDKLKDENIYVFSYIAYKNFY